jgi:hypothetical protein
MSKPNPAGRPEEGTRSLDLETARKLFDLPSHATSRQIELSYESLRGAVDPAHFAEGSAARIRAMDLQRRIDFARTLLLENIDPTVRRFERLEVE